MLFAMSVLAVGASIASSIGKQTKTANIRGQLELLVGLAFCFGLHPCTYSYACAYA